MMNNLDKQYTDLLQDILDNGVKKETRNGGTLSVFGRQIRHKMSEGFPLLTTKKMAWKTMVTELLWFLRGDTNIKYLVDNSCHIWNGDCYQAYVKKHKHAIRTEGDRSEIAIQLLETQLIYSQEEFINKIKTDDEFANKWGDLGPVYGKQWRSWERYGYRGVQNGALDCGLISMEDYKKEMYIDQIANSIHLLKTDPDSRRNRVNSWNVGELDQMILPPCHTDFQFFTRELSLEERWRFYYKKDLDINRKHGEWDSFEQSSQKNLDNLNVPKRAISLMFNMRSNDVPLGLPFNVASYGLLLEIIAKEVNMVPDELIGNLGDTHLYLNHIEQAKEQIGRELTIEERGSLYRKQQNLSDDVELVGSDRDAHRVFDDYGITKRTREPHPLPKLGKIPDYLCIKDNWECYKPSDFTLENYQSHPSIKAPLSN